VDFTENKRKVQNPIVEESVAGFGRMMSSPMMATGVGRDIIEDRSIFDAVSC
jgi:hypothetical protein